MMSKGSSFLPEDYVQSQAERRMFGLGLLLFIIIMGAVVAAFFVTNRQWVTVREEQQRINVQYASAAEQIDELSALEMQKKQLDEKAQITAALVEPVPRSILLAEIINWMPESVGLDEFELVSKEIRQASPKGSKKKSTVKSLSGKKSKDTKAEAADERRINVPKLRTTLTLVGTAPTDVHVSEYIGNLVLSPMLVDVELKYTKETKMSDSLMRQFRIEAVLAPDADVNLFEPLREARLNRNPMDDTLEIDRFNRDLVGVPLDDD